MNGWNFMLLMFFYESMLWKTIQSTDEIAIKLWFFLIFFFFCIKRCYKCYFIICDLMFYLIRRVEEKFPGCCIIAWTFYWWTVGQTARDFRSNGSDIVWTATPRSCEIAYSKRRVINVSGRDPVKIFGM